MYNLEKIILVASEVDFPILPYIIQRCWPFKVKLSDGECPLPAYNLVSGRWLVGKPNDICRI
jgi:hypothetical protein